MSKLNETHPTKYKNFIRNLLTYKCFAKKIDVRTLGYFVLCMTYEGMAIGDEYSMDTLGYYFGVGVRRLDCPIPLIATNNCITIYNILFQKFCVKCKAPPTFYLINIKSQDVFIRAHCKKDPFYFLYFLKYDMQNEFNFIVSFRNDDYTIPLAYQNKYLKKIYKDSYRKKNYHSKFINFY